MTIAEIILTTVVVAIAWALTIISLALLLDWASRRLGGDY